MDLLIDDCRNFPVDCIARTYEVGMEMLLKHNWDKLYLDHDLGAIEITRSDTGREMTGYDILCWLEENPKYLPKEITIVSDNPVGREKMEKLVEKLYKEEVVTAYENPTK